MKEKNSFTNDVIRNVEDEASEVINEIVEEIENEAHQIVDDTIGDMEKESVEIEGNANSSEQPEKKSMEDIETAMEEEPLPEKAKKHVKAKRLVEKAKKIVSEADERTNECRLLLESDLQEYEDARTQLKAGGLDACTSLVNKLGYQVNDETIEEETKRVVFETKDESKPIVLKDVSSGKFSGFILALFGGVATAIGLVYLATEKLNMTLNVTKVPSEDTVQSILAWFSTTIGVHENVYIGAGIFGIVVLLVMILIYLARVSLKASSNLHFAAKQFVEAELYTEQKVHCEEEMEKVDAHIKDIVGTLKTYEIVLNEQRGKLQRILHIEGEKEKSTEYHDKSYTEIRDTKELIRTIKDFMDTPMSEEGKLSSKSELLLQNTKDQINKVIDRFY